MDVVTLGFLFLAPAKGSNTVGNYPNPDDCFTDIISTYQEANDDL